ncbi:MAG: ThiF family adenylyltransferase [Alphaproteobacteria bacterium]
MEDRLSRMRLMVGDRALKRLKQAHILVAGCGAVGGFAVEALARAGVGHLTIVDNDVISPSNINRQLVALHSTLGQKKVEVARRRLLDIAPDIRVDVVDALINANSVDDILAYQPDFVVDAIDSLNPKVCLIEALVKAEIPFVSSMGAAMKTRPELVQLARMRDSYQCPLAAFIRKRLRRREVPLDFPVVYSPEKPDKAHLKSPEEPLQKSGRARNEMGSLPTLTGIFGLMCAQVALDYFIKSDNKNNFSS